jgi:hypothetical protein
VYNTIMENVELKLRLIDSSEFVVNYTRKIVGVLHNPQMSIEVKAGQISEDVTRLIESLGYQITAKRPLEDWVALKAVKQDN